MGTMFRFDGVSFEAPNSGSDGEIVSILKNITFEIPGKIFSVITGPSGSGKSTLLRLFNRLADPTTGEIYFHGKNIREYPVLELRRKVGWVPQVPVRFNGTVLDNIRLPFSLSRENKIPEDEINRRISRLKGLELLQEKLFSRKAEDVSVGEAQRMNLLRAMALEPDVILLDEPTSALDQQKAEQLLSQIIRIQKETSLSVIMVSHRKEEVAMAGEFVVDILDGEATVRNSKGSSE
jgi:putative ABC transport system ATP-binding protein